MQRGILNVKQPLASSRRLESCGLSSSSQLGCSSSTPPPSPASPLRSARQYFPARGLPSHVAAQQPNAARAPFRGLRSGRRKDDGNFAGNFKNFRISAVPTPSSASEDANNKPSKSDYRRFRPYDPYNPVGSYSKHSYNEYLTSSDDEDSVVPPMSSSAMIDGGVVAGAFS